MDAAMTVGPTDTSLGSQLLAQLQAGQDARLQRPTAQQTPDPSNTATGPSARSGAQSARSGQTAQQGGRPQAENQGLNPDSASARSTQRRDLVLRQPDPSFSGASELEEAESRVAQLFTREAPAGRRSNQPQEERTPALGQIIDIRV